MTRHRRRRGRSGIIELILLIALPILQKIFLPIRTLIPVPYNYIGILFMLTGFALVLWTSRMFRSAGASYQLEAESSTLMTTGPFRYSRNPMVLGMLIWLLGLATLLGSLMAFLFPALLFILAIAFIIPVEEKRLESSYREEYRHTSSAFVDGSRW
ncbi:MAG TPA: isoprenylcysteine carboxylmethyltransferase family protein [Anaerolineae bacterium]|nr:isoprenylcysteine carboxylmethyltransferase family protein [Anaerolineae bacterium]